MTTAKLFILGEERELLWINTNYLRYTAANGSPTSDVEGGFLTLSFVAQENDDVFWHNMTKEVKRETDRMEKGEVHFYNKGDEDIPVRKYKFSDAYLIEYSEVFDAYETENMHIVLTLSPAIQNYGAELVKYWNKSWIPPSEPVYYIPKKEEEDRIVYINGHFYNKDGIFEGKINEPDFEGSVNDVYVCDGKSTQKDKNGNESLTYNNTKLLKIENIVFLRIAGLAYSESGYSIDVIKRIPFIVMNHHKQLISSKIKKYHYNWPLNNTLIKMRNKWNDQTYAHTFHYGAQGNPGFRDFLNIELNENIDYDKNAEGRNNNIKMKTAIEYTIKAVQYLNNGYIDVDHSEGGIGWQGADICTNENWKKWLFIHSEHKKNAFKNWSNFYTLEESFFESVSVFKGDFGTTIIYKSTSFSYENNPTGNL
ncbi:hypothetical protein IUY40_01290 [Flavobacterium sp. ALJ2]|uniref:type VI secretion system tube protein TssD n=1 Tax=Flavobacterium sp. ALJ2 TaxID=2786960 RepID=UPI00189FDD79|nr:type VI secretion system tube protein TssD [Flavobacterium sp. ALJ2]MBF7090177.1 hypothetical protein [Flavobacterium sp. ALJ2]